MRSHLDEKPWMVAGLSDASAATASTQDGVTWLLGDPLSYAGNGSEEQPGYKSHTHACK